MATKQFNRAQTAVSGDSLYVYILDDDHVRDHPFYGTYPNVLGGGQFNGYGLTINGNYIYSENIAQCVLGDPPMAGYQYDPVTFSNVLIPDHRKYGASTGCRDVFAEIRIVEVIQGNDIAANISSGRFYMKTSVNRQIAAENFTEVPTSYFIYEDNSNIRSYSETDYINEGNNYLVDAEVSVITDPAELRVGPIKNFFVHDFPMDSVLGKSFSVEINMNSEGVLYEAKLEVANRKESGNAS